MSSIDLRRLRLRPGEVRRESVDVELEPFVLGGQRYEAHPETIPVEVEITQASGATVFDVRLEAASLQQLGFLVMARGAYVEDADERAGQLAEKSLELARTVDGVESIDDRLSVGRGPDRRSEGRGLVSVPHLR